jgi:uncharacterized protein YutE (UPF0331/DUF86 family)
MYDTERITRIIRDIDKYFADLGELNLDSVEDLGDMRNYHAASMLLFTLINRAIDLGNEIIVANNYGMALSYGEIFTILEKKGRIQKKNASELLFLVRSRNKLSHQYQDLSAEEIFKVCGCIGAVKEFCEGVKKILSEDRRKAKGNNGKKAA